MSLPVALKKPKSLRLAAAAALLPLGAAAQSEAPAQPAAALPAVTVQEQAIDPNPNAEVGAPYKAKTSADARHTRPLAETPQTIQVVTKQAIDDSGATDLKQILAAQPGITLGTGENWRSPRGRTPALPGAARRAERSTRLPSRQRWTMTSRTCRAAWARTTTTAPRWT